MIISLFLSAVTWPQDFNNIVISVVFVAHISQSRVCGTFLVAIIPFPRAAAVAATAFLVAHLCFGGIWEFSNIAIPTQIDIRSI